MPLILIQNTNSVLETCEVQHPINLTGTPMLKDTNITGTFKLITPTTVETLLFKDPSCPIEGISPYVREEGIKFKLIEPTTCPIINSTQQHCTRCGKITLFKGNCVIKKNNYLEL